MIEWNVNRLIYVRLDLLIHFDFNFSDKERDDDEKDTTKDKIKEKEKKKEKKKIKLDMHMEQIFVDGNEVGESRKCYLIFPSELSLVELEQY